MCCDTTSLNTGRLNGTCINIEQSLDKQLLFFACHHHMLELIIRAVFTACIGTSSGPDIPLFKRLQKQWELIDKEKFEDASTNEYVAKTIADVKDDISLFIFAQLLNNQQRDDYREILELALVFLGRVPPRGIRFMAPGPMHHARWMNKVIYSLKVWLFRGQITQTTKEKKGITEVAIFVIRVYLKAWMEAPLAACAPNNDLHLLKNLVKYENINQTISKTASTKLASHMWNLSEELVGLALFDRNLSNSIKQKIIQGLTNEGNDDPPKKVQINMQTIHDSELNEFVTSKSKVNFQKLNIPTSFLDKDPEFWREGDDFQTALTIVHELKVINEHAERGVH